MEIETGGPEFSIIVPVYNTEKYLNECIDSVINQIYKNWELILVDDGSTDKSPYICDRYMSLDDRIKTFHKANEGQMSTRIFGMKHATGKYCMCLDSDDYISEKLLDRLHIVLKKEKYDLIEWNIEEFGISNYKGHFSLKSGETLSREEFLESVIREEDHSLCNKLIRTELLNAENYDNVNKKVRLAEDYMQLIPVICNIKSAYYIDESLYFYRREGNSVSYSNDYVKKLMDYMYTSTYVTKCLKEHDLYYEYIARWESVRVLKSIHYEIKRGILSAKITPQMCKSVYETEYYKNVKRYEKLKYLSLEEYMVLKLFRIKQFGLFRGLIMIKRKITGYKDGK